MATSRTGCIHRTTRDDGHGRAGRSWALELATLAASGLLAANVGAQTGVPIRASVGSDGGAADGPSQNAALSADGRWIAFDSLAENLAPGDANARRDVFVHDLEHGTTLLVSRTPGGASGSNLSRAPSISADGRFVAFESFATDLVAGDTNGREDVFVFDRQTGATVLGSRSWVQGQPHGASFHAVLSADGRWLAFACLADDVVGDDDNGVADVFVRDLVLNTTRRVSLAWDGAQAVDASEPTSISADGRFVCFTSSASNLAPNDENGASDVFVRDLVAGTTELVSRASNGSPGDGASWNGALSADGSVVAFESSSTNLAPVPGLAPSDVYVRVRATGTTTRVSVASDGTPANGACDRPCLSADGRFVVFDGWASNLVPGVTGAVQSVFLHDRQLGTTELASACWNGAASCSFSLHGAIDGSGRRVAFHSGADDVVRGDANQQTDVFVRDLHAFTPTVGTFCTPGASAQGCIASISGLGVPSASAGEGFEVRVDGLEGGQIGLLFFGLSGPQSTPFGDTGGTWCVSEPLYRTRIGTTHGTPGSCEGYLSLDWNRFLDTPAGRSGPPILGTETVWAQAWIRDAKSSTGAILSDALWFTVAP